MKRKDWVMIPNSIFPSRDNTNHLTAEEGYFFSLMYRLRIPYDSVAEYSVDGISERSPYQFAAIKSNGDASRNKNKIRQLIKSLVEKEYIYLPVDIDDKRNSELLYISFYDISHYHRFAKGHNQNITYKIFDQFKNPLEFYTYAYIDCFGDVGKVMSYKDWEDIIGLKSRSVQKIIDRMNSYDFKPRIWKFSGDYIPSNKQARQEMNTYYTRPDEDTIKMWNGFYAEGRSEVKELAFGHRGGRNKEEDTIKNGDKSWVSVEEVF